VPTLLPVAETPSASAGESAAVAVAPAPSAAPAADHVFGEGEVDRVAVPMGAFTPRYPSREVQTGRQGTVVLSATIDADGQVREVAVVKSAGGGFDAAAREAVEAMPFRAAQREGRAVASSVTVRVKFQLD
jgi:TonB family protein